MYSHGVCFMPLTLNLSGQMSSAQIYKNSNKKKKERQLQLSQRSSQKQQKLKNGSQVQSSKRRGDNKQERRWMARKCKRERETKKSWREGSAAGAQGTFSLWLVFFLDVPRCRLQTSKPKARPRDRGERGRPLWVRVHAERRAAAERTSTRGEKHDLTVFRRLCLQHQPLRPHLARIRTRAEKTRSRVWLSRTIVLVPFCDEMNHHIRSYLQTPPSVRSIQLLSNDWKKEPQLARSSALNLNSYFNLSTPAVLSVPAEREASTYCQHK